MPLAVEVRELRFAYPGRAQLLAIEGFALEVGAHCFIEGASGTGKSTFLGLLSGMLLPSSGDIWIKGEAITRMHASRRDRFRSQSIGYLAQLFNLIPYLSALDNILLPLTLNGRRQTTEGSRLLDELIDELNLSPFLNRPTRELSVGQQQRVAAARAFILQPALVIADEPTSSLDEGQKNKLIHCMFQIAERHSTSLVMASHDKDVRQHFGRSFNPGASSC